jgi:Ser-tRNA(Ala) deacylase AlaX
MTELAYMNAPEQTAMEAMVESVEAEDGHVTLTLDRTPIYPQGGGQPSDTGIIEGDGYTFAIQKAVLVEGVVHHQGIVLEGEPSPGPARVRIDPERRSLHAALHSGGHLLMTAMFELTEMRAVKGYHFPGGAYVEFEGTLDQEAKEDLLGALQRRLDEMVESDEEISVESTTAGKLAAEGVYMPAEIPTGKPTRVVTTCGYRSPCGGTHVARTGKLAGLRVRRIKSKKGRTRVAYETGTE